MSANLKVFAKDQLISEEKPRRQFPEDFKFSQHVKGLNQSSGSGAKVLEFMGTGDFATQWFERQRYEVDAGRDTEPILYEPLYDIINDSNLPEVLVINSAGPGGVVFEEVFEGGEAKFVTLTSSEITVRIRNYAAMLEYTEEMFIYNRVWDIPLVERQAGVAYNALLNYLHFYPFLNATYGAGNLTAAAAGGGSLSANMVLTLEDAVAAASTDTTNPRRGSYALLISTADVFKVTRALTVVPQQGFDLQSPVISQIPTIIAYDGWTGTRGNKITSYPGVTPGTAYLIDINPSMKARYARSLMKQSLARAMGNPDLSRFIAEQVRWNVRLGVYANPTAIAEKITLPTS